MSGNQEPKVIYIRAGSGTNEQADLIGLIQRIIRESISTNNQYFVLQLAYDQQVLNATQTWKTLKQVTVKQGLALVISGGSNEAREMANEAGFAIVGTADDANTVSVDFDQIRMQVMGHNVSEEIGNVPFDQISSDYRIYEGQASARTVGGFIEFVRLRNSKK